MWFSTVWVNKHWKCPPAVRSIYFLPQASLGINTQLSHKHTKQQISLTFPQNIHHLFVPREKEESDREMRMSSMLVLGGSFFGLLACVWSEPQALWAALIPAWGITPVSAGSRPLPATAAAQQKDVKKERP